MLCAVSVDLDEIPNYHAIYGLAPPEGPASSVVYDVALDRLDAFARAHHLPLTLFVVGADLAIPANAARLRALAERGHEIANHSLDHLYDLARCPPDIMRRQVAEAADLLEAATGQRPVGFRSPGYAMTDALARMLAAAGVVYDSSVFPCPFYYGAKATAVGLIRARRRRSGTVLSNPAALAAPRRPYRMGTSFWRRGDGLLELPIQVTRRLRLPFIGTSITLAGPWGARWLVRDVIGEPLVNLELHGLDVLDDGDGLDALAPHQLDLRISRQRKLESLSTAIEALRQAGYSFVLLKDAARQLGERAAKTRAPV